GDITEQKKTENALRISEEQFRGAFETAAIGIALVSPEGHWLRVNRALCEIVGYPEPELLTLTFQEITYPDDLEADLNYVNQMLAGEIPYYHMEKRYIHKKGHIIWILLSVSLVRNENGEPLHFISQIQDITDRKNAEVQTRKSLKEKEVLLQEIHHRVKNNMTVIYSLLELQAGKVRDERYREMFNESMNRIKTMALIHEKLYRSQDLTKILFSDYIRDMVDDIYVSYGTSP
ncbi:MAG: PAS domain S-box protein, partial [Proteobacteria bacterium]|nr:PAS domain S-box protein [Pseudomonadota bacterium]